MSTLLSVKELQIDFATPKGKFNAVRGVSFDISKGKTLSLVGESGSGKSITALSLMNLLPMPPAEVSGSIEFEGWDILKLPYEDLKQLRREDIGIIFQNPTSSLNPILKVGTQIGEAITEKRALSKAEVKERTLQIMEQVGIPDPHKRYDAYPHEMSGGMNQRIMICQALINKPKLLIADEPTTALDVTIQVQVLDLIDQLKKSMGMSVLFITHNLALAYEHADDICVMYAGEIVERQEAQSIFKHYKHPYTKGLLHAIPSVDSKERALQPILGTVPSIANMPTGCRFHPRCSEAMERCKHDDPERFGLQKKKQFVKCWLYDKQKKT